ncbi:MAG: DNA-directed RNA polymerase subunit alpha [Bacilli bacterium]|nr:DNA-directed RNA polymerase subunit alpha [Bacilli bacterium]
MRKFEKPKIYQSNEVMEPNYIRVSIEPLEKGFGTTLGNALRRVLLSSIPGASMYAIEVEGARHEFSALEGIREDVTSIVLNLKGLILKINDDDNVKKELKISVKGPKVVTAADIVCPGDVEVVNKDLYIATVSAGGTLNMTIYAKNGRGYVTAENNKDAKTHFGIIPTDSNYSPVTKVAYDVEPTRMVQNGSYEKLNVSVWTNGGMTPNEAVAVASKILNDYFTLLCELSNLDKYDTVLQETVAPVVNKFNDMTIEELDLSVRSYNCLKRANIQTVQELILRTEDDLAKVRNMGKKSIKEVKDKVATLGLSFKDAE